MWLIPWRLAHAADGLSCGPNDSISDTPFASYALVRHSPKWPGEYFFTLLLDEPNNALHAIWSQTMTEGGGAIGRIFHAKGAL